MTTQLFYRHGAAFDGTPQLQDGKPVTVSRKKCGRCGGLGGGPQWAHTGYTCYECGGACYVGQQVDRLYTSEELDKLNSRQAKARATKQAKADAIQQQRQAEADARQKNFQSRHADMLAWLRARGQDDNGDYRDGFLGSLLRQADIKAQWSDAQVSALHNAMQRETERNAVKAQSRHVGTIGQRLESRVTVERIFSFERAAYGGYRTEVCYIVTMRDPDGNALVVKSPNAYGFTQGDTYQIRGTVKDHDFYRGESQTILQRVTIMEDK
jgi:hypothetical protein